MTSKTAIAAKKKVTAKQAVKGGTRRYKPARVKPRLSQPAKSGRWSRIHKAVLAFLKVSNLSLFLFLCVLSFSFLLLSHLSGVGDSLYFSFWAHQLWVAYTDHRVLAGEAWEWISYAAIPGWVAVRCLAVAFCLYTAAFFRNVKKRGSDFLKVALLAEFVTLIPLAVKIAWFGFLQPSYTMEDLAGYAPLSLFRLLSPGEMAPWFVYLLQQLDLFECLYIGVLAFLSKHVLETTFGDSLWVVVSTYGIMLLIGMLWVMFLLVPVS